MKRTGKEITDGIIKKTKEKQQHGIKKERIFVGNIEVDVKKLISQGALRIKVFKED